MHDGKLAQPTDTDDEPGTAGHSDKTLVSLTRTAAEIPANDNWPAEQELFDLVRQQFQFDADHVPANITNLGHAWARVQLAELHYGALLEADVSFAARLKLGELVENAREELATEFRVPPGSMALVRNATEANANVTNGFPYRPGDEVLILIENHATVNEAFDRRAQRYGIVVKRIELPSRLEDARQIIEAFEGAYTPRTVLVVFPHISSISGTLLPAKELCVSARAHGIDCLVDGAAAVGALAINLKDIGASAYSASLHKSYNGPKETGFLYVAADLAAKLHPNSFGYNHHVQLDWSVRDARIFENLGQRRDASLAAIAPAAKLRATLRPERIEARVRGLASDFKSSVKSFAGLITPEDPRFSAHIVTIAVSPENRQRLVDRLYHEFNISASPTGGLRISFAVYNTSEHVERIIEAVYICRDLLAERSLA